MRVPVIERWIAQHDRGALSTLIWVVFLVALPIAIRLVILPWAGPSLWYPSYYPAVLVAGLLLGPVGGVSVWLLSGLAGLFLIILPLFHYQLTRQVVAATAFYYFCSGLILAMAILCRTALRHLEAAKLRDQQMKAELHHRIRNVITVVQSLSHQSAKRANGNWDRFQEDFDGQLSAIGAALRVLAAQNWQEGRLPELPRVVLRPFARSQQITLEGPRCSLTVDAVEPLALILHELATNALKYGALSSPEGRVHIRWELLSLSTTKGACELRWEETGGPRVEAPSRRGLGSNLLRAQRGIRAVERSFDPEGFKCSMTLDIVSRRANPGETGSRRPWRWQLFWLRAGMLQNDHQDNIG